MRAVFAKLWTVRIGRRAKVTQTTRDMTPEEIAAFDAAFGEMGKAFESFSRAFGRFAQ